MFEQLECIVYELTRPTRANAEAHRADASESPADSSSSDEEDAVARQLTVTRTPSEVSADVQVEQQQEPSPVNGSLSNYALALAPIATAAAGVLVSGSHSSIIMDSEELASSPPLVDAQIPVGNIESNAKRKRVDSLSEDEQVAVPVEGCVLLEDGTAKRPRLQQFDSDEEVDELASTQAPGLQAHPTAPLQPSTSSHLDNAKVRVDATSPSTPRDASLQPVTTTVPTAMQKAGSTWSVELGQASPVASAAPKQHEDLPAAEPIQQAFPNKRGRPMKQSSPGKQPSQAVTPIQPLVDAQNATSFTDVALAHAFGPRKRSSPAFSPKSASQPLSGRFPTSAAIRTYQMHSLPFWAGSSAKDPSASTAPPFFRAQSPESSKFATETSKHSPEALALRSRPVPAAQAEVSAAQQADSSRPIIIEIYDTDEEEEHAAATSRATTQSTKVETRNISTEAEAKAPPSDAEGVLAETRGNGSDLMVIDDSQSAIQEVSIDDAADKSPPPADYADRPRHNHDEVAKAAAAGADRSEAFSADPNAQIQPVINYVTDVSKEEIDILAPTALLPKSGAGPKPPLRPPGADFVLSDSVPATIGPAVLSVPHPPRRPSTPLVRGFNEADSPSGNSDRNATTEVVAGPAGSTTSATLSNGSAALATQCVPSGQITSQQPNGGPSTEPAADGGSNALNTSALRPLSLAGSLQRGIAAAISGAAATLKQTVFPTNPASQPMENGARSSSSSGTRSSSLAPADLGQAKSEHNKRNGKRSSKPPEGLSAANAPPLLFSEGQSKTTASSGQSTSRSAMTQLVPQVQAPPEDKWLDTFTTLERAVHEYAMKSSEAGPERRAQTLVSASYHREQQVDKVILAEFDNDRRRRREAARVDLRKKHNAVPGHSAPVSAEQASNVAKSNGIPGQVAEAPLRPVAAHPASRQQISSTATTSPGSRPCLPLRPPTRDPVVSPAASASTQVQQQVSAAQAPSPAGCVPPQAVHTKRAPRPLQMLYPDFYAPIRQARYILTDEPFLVPRVPTPPMTVMNNAAAAQQHQPAAAGASTTPTQSLPSNGGSSTAQAGRASIRPATVQGAAFQQQPPFASVAMPAAPPASCLTTLPQSPPPGSSAEVGHQPGSQRAACVASVAQMTAGFGQQSRPQFVGTLGGSGSASSGPSGSAQQLTSALASAHGSVLSADSTTKAIRTQGQHQRAVSASHADTQIRQEGNLNLQSTLGHVQSNGQPNRPVQVQQHARTASAGGSSVSFQVPAASTNVQSRASNQDHPQRSSDYPLTGNVPAGSGSRPSIPQIAPQGNTTPVERSQSFSVQRGVSRTAVRSVSMPSALKSSVGPSQSASNQGSSVLLPHQGRQPQPQTIQQQQLQSSQAQLHQQQLYAQQQITRARAALLQQQRQQQAQHAQQQQLLQTLYAQQQQMLQQQQVAQHQQVAHPPRESIMVPANWSAADSGHALLQAYAFQSEMERQAERIGRTGDTEYIQSKIRDARRAGMPEDDVRMYEGRCIFYLMVRISYLWSRI